MYRQIKKDKAIELMKALDIYKPYIDGFEQSDKEIGRASCRERV